MPKFKMKILLLYTLLELKTCIKMLPLEKICMPYNRFWDIFGPNLSAKSPEEVKKKGRELGKGGFSTAYELKYKNKPAVYKKTTFTDIKSKENASFELSVLKALKGVPGVIQFYSCMHKSKEVAILMEKADFSSTEYSKMPEQKRFHQRIRTYIDFASVIKALHEKSIYHNDLKLDNILISLKEGTRVRLIDYNLSCTEGKKSPGGTFGYNPPEKAPPEIKCDCSPAIDIWGFFMTVTRYEDQGKKNYRSKMSSKCFSEKMTLQCFEKLKDNVKKILRNTPKAFRELALKSLAYTPTERPTIDKILQELKAISIKVGNRLPTDSKLYQMARPMSVEFKKNRFL